MTSYTNHTPKRRLALKALSGSALAGTLIERLPAAWQRPLVQSAAIPANAQLSSAPTRQFQLRAVESGMEMPVAVPYTLNPAQQGGEIASITIRNAPASAAQAVDWGALLPAAHAQTVNGLRVLQPVTLPFINGVASGAIRIGDGNGGACDYPIRITLNSARTDVLNIVGNPDGGGVRCGSTMIYPGTGLANDAGPQGETAATTTATSTTTTTPALPTTAALTTAAPATLDPAAGFITVWRMEADALELTIPINSDFSDDYEYRVDWGDESQDDWTGEARHTYQSKGLYTVTITGEFPAIQLYDPFAGEDINFESYPVPKLLREIRQWGHSIAWRSMRGAFAHAYQMEVTATDAPDLSRVTDMGGMFYGAAAFNGDLSQWDVSSVISMTGMFRDAAAFNGDLSQWDVSSVTGMSTMFSGAAAFNRDLSQWNVSKVTNMSSMFSGITLSTENYDALLINWSSRIKTISTAGRDAGLGTFHAGDSKYNLSAINAREAWEAKGWQITDGGPVTALLSDWTFPLTTITLYHTAGLARMALSGSHSLMQTEYGNIGISGVSIPTNNALGDDTERAGYAPIRKYDGYTIAMYHPTSNYPDNWIIYHEPTGRWWRFDLGRGGKNSSGSITEVSRWNSSATTTAAVTTTVLPIIEAPVPTTAAAATLAPMPIIPAPVPTTAVPIEAATTQILPPPMMTTQEATTTVAATTDAPTTQAATTAPAPIIPMLSLALGDFDVDRDMWRIVLTITPATRDDLIVTYIRGKETIFKVVNKHTDRVILTARSETTVELVGNNGYTVDAAARSVTSPSAPTTAPATTVFAAVPVAIGDCVIQPEVLSDWTFQLTTLTLYHTAGLERMALSGSHTLLQTEYCNIGISGVSIPTNNALGDDTERAGYAPIRKYDGYTIAMYHPTSKYPDNWIIYHEPTGRWWRFDLGRGGNRSSGSITEVSRGGPSMLTTTTR